MHAHITRRLFLADEGDSHRLSGVLIVAGLVGKIALSIARIGVDTCTVSFSSFTSTTIEPPLFVTRTGVPP